MKLKSLFALTLITLSACVSNQNVSSTNMGSDLPYTFSQFSDIPIPEGATMNLDKTSIFGRENDWLGKMTFSAPYNVGGVFDFYMSEMPKFGWNEITSVRGTNSVLTYSRDSRVALIQLEPSVFEGTNITFTMSPEPKKTKNVKFKQDMKKTKTSSMSNFKLTQKEPKNEDGLDTISVTQSSIFVSPDAQKASAGSLGLGDASNVNYPSSSNGVGKPPRF